MTEEQNGITPTRPVTAYAPEPSGASRDRDPDGALVPTGQQPRRRKKKKKKKKDRPEPPSDRGESSGDSEGGGKVDILAGSIRIEMPERNDPAEFAARSGLARREAAQGTQPHGTAIAY